MNEKIEKFIKEFEVQQANKLEAENKKHRETVLIAAGMCDRKKNWESTKTSESYPYFDKADNRPYRLEAWEVTDAEYDEVVKHLPEDMVNNPEKYLPTTQKGSANTKAEDMVNVASFIMLGVGILGFIIFFILAGAPQRSYHDWFEDFSWASVAYGIALLVVGFVNFALMQVFRNISLKLDK